MSLYNSSKLVLVVLVSGIALFISTFGQGAAKADLEKIATVNSLSSIVLPVKAKVIDLTQTISMNAPSYSGKAGDFKYETLSTIDKDGYAAGAFYMHEHFGTHIDAPVHFCAGAATIDKLNPNNLVLQASVLDVRDESQKNPDYLLTVEKIKEFEKTNTIAPHAAILLLTGWSKRYLLDGQYRNADSKGVMHYPGFSVEAAKYLIDRYKISALGIDTLSIDFGPSEDFLVHRLVLSQGLFMVENLTNLDQLPACGAVVVFAPLKIAGGTGSPARVLALTP